MSDAIDDSDTAAAAQADSSKSSSERAEGTRAHGNAPVQESDTADGSRNDSHAATDDVETEAFALAPSTGPQDVLDSYTAPDDDGADMEFDGDANDGAGSEDASAADSSDSESDDADDGATDAEGGDVSGATRRDDSSRKRIHLTDYAAADGESRPRASSYSVDSDDPDDYLDDDSANPSDPTESEEYRSMRNQFSTAFDLIDSLIDEVNAAPGGLFNHDQARINRTNLVDELTNLKKLLPVQLSHASNLMRQANYRLDDAQTEANSIVSDARAKAAKIISAAEERAEFLAGQENVVAIANDKASAIMSAAQKKADKLTIGADEYCENVMGELSQQLQHISASVNEGVRVIGERKAAAQRDLEALNAQLADDDQQ
ncbi:hypothetical protein [Pseudoscardovia suis]|uniref:Cell division protein n=1 Tax=Pseudoscardovia suis TaxID=987063 RepID=A0A261EUH0_9BIFI|nr:hypothetical protein [Pseudoscardovia suis]OZG50510.1 hypothetical protein PSSU_1222 [Pseudoscardovia suis]PJJ65906.1 hypothetical protein CLV65_1153 [Pseudoscardovia suis]